MELATLLNMISKTESVWRYLLAAALERDERRQPSITAIASELGLGVSTVHKALERPTTIGAVVVHPSRGVRVIDPWRLLVLWAGKRNLENDVLCRSTSALSPDQIERRVQESDAVLSGFGGIVSHLGSNPIASYDTVVYYGAPLEDFGSDADGPTRLLVLEPDPLLGRYGRVAPLAQCYVDLFNLPGWQAARFVAEVNDLVAADAAA